MDETTATTTTINYDDFAKLELRVGTVLECKAIEKSKKLLVLQLEMANGERRQICSGIRQWYTPEQLIGKQVIVVANLAPREMFGLMSHGMLLAAHDAGTDKVVVMGPSEPVAAGSKVS
jgi:methionyl-tRNA synthetase